MDRVGRLAAYYGYCGTSYSTEQEAYTLTSGATALFQPTNRTITGALRRHATGELDRTGARASSAHWSMLGEGSVRRMSEPPVLVFHAPETCTACCNTAYIDIYISIYIYIDIYIYIYIYISIYRYR